MHLGLISPNVKNKEYSRPVYTVIDSKTSELGKRSLNIYKDNILILNSSNFNEINKYPGMIKADANDAFVITPLHNLNLNEALSESLFEKRDRNEKLFCLAELVYLSDGVVVPIDYNELKSSGCTNITNLKLLNTLVFLLGECFESVSYPSIHFIIYNWNDVSTWDSYKNSFFQRQKEEIHQILHKFIANSGKRVNTTCEFTSSAEKSDWVAKLYPTIRERIKLHQECKSDFKANLTSRIKACETIKILKRRVQDSVYDLSSRTNPNKLEEVKGIALSYNYLIDLIKKLKKQMATFLNDTNNYGRSMEWYKREIDLMVSNSLKELSVTAQVVKGCEDLSKELRNRLIESIKEIVIEFIDSLALRMHDEVVQEFRNNISRLTISPKLDEELEDAIREADSLYYKRRRKLEPKILVNDVVYKAKFQSQRADLIQNLREISNHILEYAISSGMYYHRISIRDGILLLPQNFVIKYLYRLLNKVKIPLRISLNYLSPSAFGFSNLFRNKDTLSPQICRYFTHSDSVKRIIPNVFSENKSIRDEANKRVHLPD